MNRIKGLFFGCLAILVLLVSCDAMGSLAGDRDVLWQEVRESASYKVSFITNGGTPAPAQQTVPYGGKATEPNAMIKSDCLFLGWFKEAEGIEKWDFTNDIVLKNITLYAKWEDVPENSHAVTFIVYNFVSGTMPPPQLVEDGGKIIQPDNPERLGGGFIFDEWYKENNFITPWIFDSDTVNKATTLYGNWKQLLPGEYAVRYIPNGGNPVPVDEAFLIGTKLNEPLISKNGFTFGGWYKDESCAKPWLFDRDTVSGTTVLYAQWNEKDHYTVNFITDGGEPVPAQQIVVVLGNVAEPEEPAKTGYIFDGWYYNETTELQSKWTFNNPVTANLMLYAKWTPQIYTINYRDVGGGSFSGDHEGGYPTTHTYDTATTLDSPTRLGYNFAGWFMDSAGMQGPLTSLSATGYTANITLYAKWEQTFDYGSFSITFIDSSGFYYTSGLLSITGNGTYTISMRSGVAYTETERILVAPGVNADITLSGVHIDLSETENACAFDMSGATVNLTLVGDNILKSGDSRAGLEAPDGSTLVITETSTGALTAEGGSSCAGIGGGDGGSGGTISISGGNVTAHGGYGSGAAGIGSGNGGSGGTISISGGIVTAYSGSYGGAGIGGGESGAISISGGIIEADSYGGTGIGGLYWESDSTISITGGTITAEGGHSPGSHSGVTFYAGIGGNGIISAISGNAVVFASSIEPALPSGDNLGPAIVFDRGVGTMYGNVTLARDITISGILSVNGGQTLTIQSGSVLTNNGIITKYDGGNIIGTITGNQPIASPFIISGGSAYTYSGRILTITGNGIYTIGMRNGVTVTTFDRIVVAPGVIADITLHGVNTSMSGDNLCAFDMSGAIVNLTLVGDNILQSGGYRAGLEVPEGSTLAITETSNGTLAVGGGSQGAGIGGGSGGSGGTISISGGTVTAYSGSYGGAGIGGGYEGSGGTISISGGTVTAYGGSYGGAGIGGGYEGSGGTISISGGTVTARGGYEPGGAGIGGGYGGSGGTISISGGTIDAYGSGVGIGGGSEGSEAIISAINGNAIVFASYIEAELPTGENLGPAIIFEGYYFGTMYGNVILQQDITFSEGIELSISAGQSLTIPYEATLTNNGTINNSGTIYRYGVINGTGSITGNQPVQ